MASCFVHRGTRPASLAEQLDPHRHPLRASDIRATGGEGANSVDQGCARPTGKLEPRRLSPTEVARGSLSSRKATGGQG